MKYRISAYLEIDLPHEPNSDEAFNAIVKSLHGNSKYAATLMVEGPIVEGAAPVRNMYLGREPVSTEKHNRAW